MLSDLIKFNRSYRRFYQSFEIPEETLIDCVELARLSPSPKNLQPYKFVISNKSELNKKIFETLAWAGYLTNWAGPEEGERPAAYVLILEDKNISQNLDKENLHNGCGIVAQSILLGLAEKGIGACIIASIMRSKLAIEISLPKNYEILLVLAIGKSKEEVVLDDLDKTGRIQYWRDEEKVHHVPKRKLEDIILDFNH
jgi:nitroreductase